MNYVVETLHGKVISIVPCETESLASEVAKKICKDNGILFAGAISVDGTIGSYSVQIV